MSNQELYEVARRGVDRRNLRMMLWGVDLVGLIVSVAVMIVVSRTHYETLSIAVMTAWAGIFVLHTIILSMSHLRVDDIEKEVAKLREHEGAKRSLNTL